MSLYHGVSGHRYVLRTDGFTSIHAPFEGGEMITRAFTCAGTELVLNCSTSASGAVRVEMQKPDGTPLTGHSLEDCDQIVCDSIERMVTWNGKKEIQTMTDAPVRLRFVMNDADLYSFRFR
jgi:hypothetical protein